jgi:hypothetical protein
VRRKPFSLEARKRAPARQPLRANRLISCTSPQSRPGTAHVTSHPLHTPHFGKNPGQGHLLTAQARAARIAGPLSCPKTSRFIPLYIAAHRRASPSHPCTALHIFWTTSHRFTLLWTASHRRTLPAPAAAATGRAACLWPYAYAQSHYLLLATCLLLIALPCF